jgi:hypothetical protein
VLFGKAPSSQWEVELFFGEPEPMEKQRIYGKLPANPPPATKMADKNDGGQASNKNR